MIGGWKMHKTTLLKSTMQGRCQEAADGTHRENWAQKCEPLLTWVWGTMPDLC